VGCSPKCGRFLGAVEYFVLCGTYTPFRQEYAAFVTWHSWRRVKAQDSYLLSS
jgi:hypothetical protein